MGSNMRELGSGASAGGADKIRIVLVHENDRSKGGCEFGTLFATTPQELIEEGIYKEIAIALHTPPHRAVSLRASPLWRRPWAPPRTPHGWRRA